MTLEAEGPVVGEVSIRPVQDDDDLDAINVGNVNWDGAATIRKLFAASPNQAHVLILVAVLDGESVGFMASAGEAISAGGYGIAQVFVQPHARRLGIGRQFMERAGELMRTSGRPGVMFSVPDAEPDGLAVAQRLGLVEHGYHIESAFDLAVLTDEVVDREGARATAAGYTLAVLPDEASEEDWHEAFDFFSERMVEAPDSRDGGGAMPYPIYRTFIDEPWQLLLARHGARIAGVTALTVRADAPMRLNTVFTGVHPDDRGAGLSAAMKTAHARVCRDRGWREIVTQNMEQNAPILAVNRRLGFHPIAGAHDFGLAVSP